MICHTILQHSCDVSYHIRWQNGFILCPGAPHCVTTCGNQLEIIQFISTQEIVNLTSSFGFRGCTLMTLPFLGHFRRPLPPVIMASFDIRHLCTRFCCLAMDSSKIRPSPVPHGRTSPRRLSSVIKVSSFGILPPPPKGDAVIYVQPLIGCIQIESSELFQSER